MKNKRISQGKQHIFTGRMIGDLLSTIFPTTGGAVDKKKIQARNFGNYRTFRPVKSLSSTLAMIRAIESSGASDILLAWQGTATPPDDGALDRPVACQTRLPTCSLRIRRSVEGAVDYPSLRRSVNRR